MRDIMDFEAMAMLELTDKERETIGTRFCCLADSFDAVEQINTDHALPLVSVLELCSIMREDVIRKLLTRDELLSNAPEQYDGYFQVPGTLE